MEKNELEYFKAALEKLEGDLLKDLAGAGDQAATVSLDDSIGRLSRADALRSQQIGLALEGNIKTRLNNARRALEAMKKGNYGNCSACGKPIAEARLRAMPETPVCVNCSARER